MLGHTVAQLLSSESSIQVLGSFHSQEPHSLKVQSIDYFKLDASLPFERELRSRLEGVSYVVNCLGLIWQRANWTKNSAQEFEMVNTRFAERVGSLCDELNIKLIQVSTDCVFSGTTGGYLEFSPKDANDPYGRSKSLAEDVLPNAIIFRTSVIGMSPHPGASLLDWFMSIEEGQTIAGYTNHLWNGVTNFVYARIIRGVIQDSLTSLRPGLYHIVPKNTVSKYELLVYFQRLFDRQDISIRPTKHPVPVDRTLSTARTDLNRRLWNSAGYSDIMNIEDMIRELAGNTMGDLDAPERNEAD
jgi:dTDP-4-dehydrorhamnose reductase